MSRRGRKRRQGKREPNGRLSRRKVEIVRRDDMTEQEARSVAIAARMRRTGLPEELCGLNEAGRPNAGTVHGVLALTGGITLDQWQAAEWYLAMRNEWLNAILARGAVGEGEGGSSHGLDDSDDYIEWCDAVRECWGRVLALLADLGVMHRSPIAAAFDVILVNQTPRMDHLLGDLRLGLNAIHRAFLSDRRRAA